MAFTHIVTDTEILKALDELGFEDPTSIQEETIPLTLEGKDVIGHAKTGSGKTLAFGTPILHTLSPRKEVQALIVCPTRELVNQVAEELSKYAKYKEAAITTVYGGVGINPQIDALRTAQIVVGTPGRILDHMERRTIDLSHVRVLVLDEADRMLDMGFIEDVSKIVSQTPSSRQTLLFSATMPTEVKNLAKRYMNDPQHVQTSTHVTREYLPQYYYTIESSKKFSLLLHLIKDEDPNKGLIFCATRRTVDWVAKNLHKHKIKTGTIHGGLSQAKREQVLEDFQKGKIHLMIATDVAARGLHIKDISHVFNYDVPRDSENYIHRIGRTARAGKSGKAITLLEQRDFQHFQKVLDIIHIEPEELETPAVKQVQVKTGSDSNKPRNKGRGNRRDSPARAQQNTREARRRRRERRNSNY